MMCLICWQLKWSSGKDQFTHYASLLCELAWSHAITCGSTSGEFKCVLELSDRIFDDRDSPIEYDEDGAVETNLGMIETSLYALGWIFDPKIRFTKDSVEPNQGLIKFLLEDQPAPLDLIYDANLFDGCARV